MDQLAQASHTHAPSIASIAHDCRSQLRACTLLPDLMRSQWAHDRLSDFNLWDSGIGASARARDSLDTRLQDDEITRKVVTTSLNTLKAWISLCQTLGEHTCTSTRATESKEEKLLVASQLPPDAEMKVGYAENITLGEAKSGVEELQSLLVQLGVAIRHAGAASRLSNADRFFEKHRNDEDIVNLTDHLRFTLRLANPPREIPHMEVAGAKGRLDSSLLIERVNLPQESLEFEQDIIVRACALRRNRFHYAEKRSRSLGVASGSSGVKSSSTAGATLDVPQYDTERKEKKGSHSEYSSSSSNQLSTHKPDISLAKMHEDIRITGPATVRALRSDYPRPPNATTTSIVCPFCHVTMSSQIARDNALWRLVICPPLPNDMLC
jgi:hypothetical protein